MQFPIHSNTERSHNSSLSEPFCIWMLVSHPFRSSFFLPQATRYSIVCYTLGENWWMIYLECTCILYPNFEMFFIRKLISAIVFGWPEQTTWLDDKYCWSIRMLSEYKHTCMFVIVNFDALAQAYDFRIERGQVVFLCWMQDSKPGSQTPNRQQTECPLTNRLSYRGSS